MWLESPGSPNDPATQASGDKTLYTNSTNWAIDDL
jgi:hypothetical protein